MHFFQRFPLFAYHVRHSAPGLAQKSQVVLDAPPPHTFVQNDAGCAVRECGKRYKARLPGERDGSVGSAACAGGAEWQDEAGRAAQLYAKAWEG